MTQLDQILSDLPERHRTALSWFAGHAGHDIGWPGSLPDGTLLATRAKGIYKPAWTQYALSARESISGPYHDKQPNHRPDGTWSYEYNQESRDPSRRDLEYANRGMMACWRDAVPVGVLRQSQPAPSPRYQVLGVAQVAGWAAGYFFLEGFAANGWAHDVRVKSHPSRTSEESRFSASGEPELKDLVDGRNRVLASIVQRRGQQAFRRGLMRIYGGQCAITGCGVESVLEAAHIMPYRGLTTNHLSNGLLLRADLHTLFDLGQLAIDPENMTLVLSPVLLDSEYSSLQGRRLRPTSEDSIGPDHDALQVHRRWCNL